MKKSLLTAALALLPLWLCAQTELNPQPVKDLLNRIGGTGTAERFETALDKTLSSKNGEEVFVVGAKDGKPYIQGSTLSALTTGINWYLNHTAHVNLAWNQLTTDLSQVELPLPQAEERHSTTAAYRYYLNYCTFSYSMSTWTWERWQQEIDWMALHGINMPLQIIGLDVVWRNMLMEDLGYTKAEANQFIAGPCFQAWWGMNNLEGWGGPNPDWWYTRQTELAQKILARQRELGMDPVLPGYSGMVPSDIGEKGYKANNQGNWCNFVRPYILDPNSEAFETISALYYKRLEELMGTSRYYSMDPFHEGANTSGIDVPSAYKKIGQAMTAAREDAQWVIQFWQWNGAQYNVLSQIEKGKLIVLDLYSDAHTHFGDYQGHDAVYCALPNFGGRTGFFGRLGKMMTEYYKEKNAHANVKGIGATPEAIEQVPILYDALFELPWRKQAPDLDTWLADYALARYGQQNAQALEAWKRLANSSLACPTSLQGPMEAVVCARPDLNVGRVSSWGGTEIFYDAQEVVRSAHLLLQSGLMGENMSYDLTDIARQALTDYANYLLKAVSQAHSQGNTELYKQRRDTYLQLMLDIDQLLCTNKNFMLGHWTQMARGIADEAEGTSEKDRQWLELNNARTLITTWGDRAQSEGGGLRDYSYREWGGMLKDFYYPRWVKYFDGLDKGNTSFDWFQNDHAWAMDASKQYTTITQGETREVATRLLAKHFTALTNGTTTYYALGAMDNDLSKQLSFNAYRGEEFIAPVVANRVKTLGIDLNDDGAITEDEQFGQATIILPTNTRTGNLKANITLDDATTISFTLIVRDHITEPRTVSVASANDAQGKAGIQGSKENSVTNQEEVTIVAEPVSGYDFQHWTDEEGNVVSTANPYTYYGAQAANFTAHFIINKWGSPKEDKSEWNTIRDYGQYASEIAIKPSDADAMTLYTATICPEQLFQTTQIATAAAGSKFHISWKDAGTNGFSYCRLSAYIDMNSDGDFNDEGECLGTIGNKESQNNVLSKNGIDVLLPYDAALGITHIRLRFDGAWQTSDLNATTDAKPANATTLRMVYDIPLNIVSQSPRAAEVTVLTADVQQGTVDANGQPDTYIYKVGEQVVLRCYPAQNYELDHWTDQYGRRVPTEWMDGNFLRFHAPESGSYTAHFRSNKQLGVTNWTFRYEDVEGGVRLLMATNRQEELDLSAENTVGKPIVEIANDVFQNDAILEAITLPATLRSMDRLVDTEQMGNGTQNATISLPRPLYKGQPWIMNIEGESNGSSFNQWGSGLLATGTDALGSNYNGGFQLYLTKSGTLTVKVGSTENRFTNALGATFRICAEYDGQGKLTITTTNHEGTTEKKVLNQTLNNITTFCTALPKGIDINRLSIDDPYLGGKPFQGTQSLIAILVEQGNNVFSSKDGALYNVNGNVLLHMPARNSSYEHWLTPVENIKVNHPTETERIYTLTGQRATSNTRGIVVKSGRKITKK